MEGLVIITILNLKLLINLKHFNMNSFYNYQKLSL